MDPQYVDVVNVRRKPVKLGDRPAFFLSMLTAMRHDMAELVDVDPESNTTTKFIMPVLVK